MNKSRSISGNSSFGSIRYAPLSKVLPDANKHEKAQTPVIHIEGLRSISRIVRAIKERIDAGERTRPGDDTQRCLAGDPRSTIPTCPNRGEDNNRESANN